MTRGRGVVHRSRDRFMLYGTHSLQASLIVMMHGPFHILYLPSGVTGTSGTATAAATVQVKSEVITTLWRCIGFT